MNRSAFLVIVAGVAGAAAPAGAADQTIPTNVEIVGHVVKPVPVQPTAERRGALHLPDGFKIEVFADGLVNPRMLAVGRDGTVYATRRSVGDVVMLRDSDGDGRADQRKTVASRPGMHGIAIEGDRMFLATVRDVYVATIGRDGTLGPLKRIIDDLPDGGQHPNRTLAVGPDGMLYISAGSTCNACAETNPESATMLRAKPDGSSRTIYASGLRNTIGFGWSDTGELYGFDHGMDWLGDEEQGEELNRIVEGRKYGWPYIYADGKHNPQDEPPGGIPLEEWARTSEEPALLYTPHAAPMQMAFYTGDAFPAAYRGDAFVAMRGSWNRKTPSGYEVVRVHFEDGRPQSIEPFLTGFLVDQGGGRYGYLGRPTGVAVAADGALLVADDSNGVIYRVSYAGSRDTTSSVARQVSPKMAPSEAEAQPTDEPVQLAMTVAAPPAKGPLAIASSAFADGSRIPATYSEYGEGVSPPLAWDKGPAGTQSFVLLLEDPDAPSPKPFVHWVAYDIPADVHGLREGLPEQPRLELPALQQGRNSRGSVGYFGMKPADAAVHHYHFQLFALDTTLGLPSGAGREEVLAAMQGHVLAAGDLMGTFKQP